MLLRLLAVRYWKCCSSTGLACGVYVRIVQVVALWVPEAPRQDGAAHGVDGFRQGGRGVAVRCLPLGRLSRGGPLLAGLRLWRPGGGKQPQDLFCVGLQGGRATHRGLRV